MLLKSFFNAHFIIVKMSASEKSGHLSIPDNMQIEQRIKSAIHSGKQKGQSSFFGHFVPHFKVKNMDLH